MPDLDELKVELNRIARDMAVVKQMMATAVTYMRDAESEIPEKMRRFANYFHDMHHIKWVYEEGGHDVPPHILRELERLDDRYRQLLKELHLDGGTFEKVRREMAKDTENRWDHTRLLPGQTKEKPE